MMKTISKRAVLGLSLAGLLLADFSLEAPIGLTFVAEAEARFGRPLTPVSVAGVARRTTRRAVVVGGAAATTAAVATTAAASSAAATPPPAPAASAATPVGSVVKTLPSGCVETVIDDVEYYNCAPGVYYRAAFQGDDLVYVSTKP
jgi:hypothetical protein